MNIKEIQDLIKFVAKSGVSEVEIEQNNFKIIIKSEDKSKEEKQILVQAPAPVAVPMPVVASARAEAPAPEIKGSRTGGGSEDSKYVTITSPMIGTFYRSSGPDKDTFCFCWNYNRERRYSLYY